MNSPWTALAILFTARCAMAFQYQVVAALGPLFMQRHGANLADMGVLIALYMLPGLVFALPGGAIAQKFGDRRIVVLGLTTMIAGGVIMWQGDTWTLQIIGRVLAGTGGVVLNVLMSKMVADWFAGGKLATAMGIFVNSWPVGIALALLILPSIAAAGGLNAAFAVSVFLCIGGFILMTGLYRNPPETASPTSRGGWPKGRILTAILIAGSVWGFYNGALIMIFAFGPTLLVERGAGLTEASGISALVLWLTAISIPVGGILGDRFGRPHTVLMVGLAAFATTFALALFSPTIPVFILMGLVCGLPAGPIMALPAGILPPATRALGMGLFFTIYYLWMVLTPIVTGAASEWMGSADAAFVLGMVMLGLTAAGTLILKHPRMSQS